MKSFLCSSFEEALKDLQSLKILSFQDGLNRLHLFSTNEHISDVDTEHLPFLLTDAFAGYAQSLQKTQNKEERLNLITQIQRNYSCFVMQCEAYGLWTESDHFLLENKRDAKIARFRHESKLESNLVQLSLMKMNDFVSCTILLNASDIHSLPSDEEFTDPYRTFCLLLLRRWILKSNYELDFLKRENELLTTPKLERKLESFTPFTLVKQKIKDEVFRPFNLPTMTIDEYLDLESKRGGMVKQSTKQESSDSEDDFVANKKTLKLRKWDEFTDGTMILTWIIHVVLETEEEITVNKLGVCCFFLSFVFLFLIGVGVEKK